MSFTTVLVLCAVTLVAARCPKRVDTSKIITPCHTKFKDNESFCTGHRQSRHYLRSKPTQSSSSVCTLKRGIHVVRDHDLCGFAFTRESCENTITLDAGVNCKWEREYCQNGEEPCTPCTPPEGKSHANDDAVCIEEAECNLIGGEAFASSEGAVGCRQYSSHSVKCCNRSPVPRSKGNGRCVIPLSKLSERRDIEHVFVKVDSEHADCNEVKGWLPWVGRLTPLSALGRGAHKGHCQPGGIMPGCAWNKALQLGDWSTSLQAQAQCTIKHESGGNPFAMGANTNSDRNIDLGLMQINTGFGHCAACDMDPKDTLCEIYCWELTDPVKAATCAKKVYLCHPGAGFSAWYGYGHGDCSTAYTPLYPASSSCTVPVGPSADPNDRGPVLPEPDYPVPVPKPDIPPSAPIVDPNSCPPEIDCTVLSEECRAKHGLVQLISEWFWRNPPRECQPTNADETACGAFCKEPESLKSQGSCVTSIGNGVGGECFTTDECTVSGLAYERNGQCPGTSYCCAKLACVPADFTGENRERLDRSQCAHVDYCKEKGGIAYPTNRPSYVNTCSGHPSKLVQCCEFPAGTTHDIWSQSTYTAYRMTDGDGNVLPTAATAFSTSFLVLLATILALTM